VVLLVGSNIRWEAPLIATRVRKVVKKGGKVFAIGPEVDLDLKVEWLGNDLKLLGKLPKAVKDAFAAAERPAVIVGPGALATGGLGAALALVEPLGLIRDGWNGFNVLHISASRMASIILGYAQPGGLTDIEAAAPELALLLGADEMPADRLKSAYKVYIGHHGDNGARQADLVLPAAAYAEKHGTWVNTEGRVQRGQKAAFPPGEAREDWAIFRAVSELAGKVLPFDDFGQLRARMVKEFPQLGRDGLIDLPWSPPKLSTKAEGPVRYPIGDFFLTNAICRASPTMQRCSEELVKGVQFKEAAE
jgi:NADH-quinone oxidoreductase subunit G